MRPSQRPPFTEAEIEAKWPEHARRLRFHIDKPIVLHVTPDDAEAWRMALQMAESVRGLRELLSETIDWVEPSDEDYRITADSRREAQALADRIRAVLK